MKAELKPEELRCGNTLEYFIDDEETATAWIPTSIDWQDIKWCTEEPEGFNNLHRPIELSEEWLKKAGAEYRTGIIGRYEHYNGHWALNNLWFMFNNGKLIFCMEYYIHSVMIEYGREIGYVHEFQNAVYALTGNELIFNHG